MGGSHRAEGPRELAFTRCNSSNPDTCPVVRPAPGTAIGSWVGCVVVPRPPARSGGAGGVGWSLEHPEDHAEPKTSGVGCILNPNRGGLCCSRCPSGFAVSRDFAVVRLAFSLDNFTPAPAPHLAPCSLRRSCFRSPSRCHSRFLLPASSLCLCLLVGPELGFAAPTLLNMARQGCRGRALALAKIDLAHATRTDGKKSRRTRDYFSVRPIDHFTPNLLDCARANKIISQTMDQRL